MPLPTLLPVSEIKERLEMVFPAGNAEPQLRGPGNGSEDGVRRAECRSRRRRGALGATESGETYDRREGGP